MRNQKISYLRLLLHKLVILFTEILNTLGYNFFVSEKEPVNPINFKVPVYDLWREDDYGNRFLMDTLYDLGQAKELQEMFQAKGHKQLYEVKQRFTPTDTS